MNKALDALQPYADEERRTDGDFKDLARASLVLSQMLRGEVLPQEWWADEKRAVQTHTWIPAMARGVNPGDTVRVKPDAYEGIEVGHNGRVGTVVAIRNGVIVSYNDQTGTDTVMGVRHPLDKLELQARIRKEVTQ